MGDDGQQTERHDYESGVQLEDGMELRVWLRLLTCTNLLDAQVRTNLKQTAETTLPRFDILAQLERHDGPMSMGDLSKRLMVSNGNVTGLIDRLAGEGLGERAPSPDDRRRARRRARRKLRRTPTTKSPRTTPPRAPP